MCEHLELVPGERLWYASAAWPEPPTCPVCSVADHQPVKHGVGEQGRQGGQLPTDSIAGEVSEPVRQPATYIRGGEALERDRPEPRQNAPREGAGVGAERRRCNPALLPGEPTGHLLRHDHLDPGFSPSVAIRLHIYEVKNNRWRIIRFAPATQRWRIFARRI